MTGQIDPTFGKVFSGLRVLVTGHSGFKGGWLSVWLHKLGAQVVGVSLPPEKGHSFYEAVRLPDIMDSRFADIREPLTLQKAVADVDADVVFHLAAQPLVRLSYRQPAETFATNVSGTAHVLDAALKMKRLKAVVVVTSDKCYDNKEWTWGYRENDPLGGKDPYSASKGCTELVAQSYQHSFFADPQGPQLATARAGNVFGGGDWGEDRLIPDIVRATAARAPLHIRSPFSVRPWQHVLEPLSGYLGVAAQLLTKGQPFAGPWNFGPNVSGTVNVRDLAAMIQQSWGQGAPEFTYPQPQNGATDEPHEAGILRLDSTKAQTQLGWQPQLELQEAAAMTVDWYRAHAENRAMSPITEAQIDHFSKLMLSDLNHTATVAAQ